MVELGSKNIESSNSGEKREAMPVPVYYVESPTDKTVLVGIDVEVVERGGEKYVTWHDTAHERMMKAVEIQQKDDYFAFRRDNGNEYYFEPMTCNIYNEKVKDKLNGGDFENDAALIEAFRRSIED